MSGYIPGPGGLGAMVSQPQPQINPTQAQIVQSPQNINQGGPIGQVGTSMGQTGVPIGVSQQGIPTTISTNNPNQQQIPNTKLLLP